MEPQSCDCTTSTLFQRAMDLIDPPRWSTDTTNNDDCSSRYDDNVERDGDTSQLELHGDENTIKPVVKKVKFGDSTCFAPKTVTAADAIQAYDLLVQAASRSTSLTREALTQIAWNEVQTIADVYRALLVTSCLLLELLSKETSVASASQIDCSIGQPCRLAQNEKNPLTRTSVDHVPDLSPRIEQGLLSAARRAILLLQALERICTAKSVAENTGRGASTNLFSLGGDDIHDYERSETDLVSNYDFHDDGHLPPASRSSVLHECCYLPIQQDPPCSRFERNAWTRHWRRDERLVSMNIEDYIDNVQYDDVEDPSRDSEVHSRGEEGIPLPELSCSNHEDDGVEPTDNSIFSEGDRKKRRRTTNSSTVKQSAIVEDRNDIVKEGFLTLSCDSFGALLENDQRSSSNHKGFLRVYCKLHISGWLSIEDRSIRLKTNDVESPMNHTRKCLKYFIYSGTTCQPCLPDGTMSFHFRLDDVRDLGPSMIFNQEYETKTLPAKNDTVESKLLFAVDEDAGSTFADGCGWVNALSGAAAKAASLRDKIRLEWNELGS